MAQFESVRDEIRDRSWAFFIAAQKRGGLFKPEKFLAEHPVSFPFLLDENRQVTKAYGLYHRMGMDAFHIAHPATLVIDKGGVIRYLYVGANQHDRAPMDKVLEAIRRS